MTLDFTSVRAAIASWEAPCPDDWTPEPTIIFPTLSNRRSPMCRKFIAIVLGLCAFIYGGNDSHAQPTYTNTPSISAPAPEVVSVNRTLRRGDRGDDVKTLQQTLTKGGWPTKADGIFGPTTEKMVKGYQKANGLVVDGIAGPKTLGSLGIWRIDLPRERPVIEPRPAPGPIEGVGPCPQWTQTAYDAGWPKSELEWLSGIMWRESGCNPLAYNGRNRDQSYGLIQINTKGALWGELQWRCGLTSKDQLWDAHTNLACGYKLYLAYGKKPWRVG